MQRVILVSIAALLSTSAAFADPINQTSGEEPSLRFGVAFGDPVNVTLSGPNFRGFNNVDITTSQTARPYIGFGLPVALTDKWSVALNGDISFTSSNDLDMNSTLTNSVGAVISARDFLATDEAYWGSMELLASYDLGDRVSFANDFEVFGGLRWDYGYARASNAQGTFTNTADFVHYRQETLTPVVGLKATFKGSGQRIFGGDVHVSAMAGPIVWGRMDYREDVLAGVNQLHLGGGLNSGYFWKLYGDMEIVSFDGMRPGGMGGGISLFAQVSQTSVSGSGMMEDLSTAGGFATPRSYSVDSDSVVPVIGISANLKF